MIIVLTFLNRYVIILKKICINERKTLTFVKENEKNIH